MTKRTKRKGLGVAPYCLPEKSLADPVSHDELQRELRLLRVAIMRLAARSHDLSTEDGQLIVDCLKEPHERAEASS